MRSVPNGLRGVPNGQTERGERLSRGVGAEPTGAARRPGRMDEEKGREPA